MPLTVWHGLVQAWLVQASGWPQGRQHEEGTALWQGQSRVSWPPKHVTGTGTWKNKKKKFFLNTANEFPETVILSVCRNEPAISDIKHNNSHLTRWTRQSLQLHSCNLLWFPRTGPAYLRRRNLHHYGSVARWLADVSTQRVHFFARLLTCRAITEVTRMLGLTFVVTFRWLPATIANLKYIQPKSSTATENLGFSHKCFNNLPNGNLIIHTHMYIYMQFIAFQQLCFKRMLKILSLKNSFFPPYLGEFLRIWDLKELCKNPEWDFLEWSIMKFDSNAEILLTVILTSS